MKCIVAVDSEWGIGKDNELLVHLSGDLKYFKENTLGKILIMGRKTVESLPGGKPLPGRTTIILTKNREYVPNYRENADTYVCYSKQEVDRLIESLKAAGKSSDDFIVAGGGSIYEMFIMECEQFLVTRIGASFGADTYFPNLDLLEKENKVSLKWHSEKMEENGTEYIFTIYTKCN